MARTLFGASVSSHIRLKCTLVSTSFFGLDHGALSLAYPYKCLVNVVLELEPGARGNVEDITVKIDFESMGQDTPVVHGCTFIHLCDETNFERHFLANLQKPISALDDRWFEYGYSRLFSDMGEIRQSKYHFWSRKHAPYNMVELVGRSMGLQSSKAIVTLPICLFLGFSHPPTRNLSASFKFKGHSKPRSQRGRVVKLFCRRSFSKGIGEIVLSLAPSIPLGLSFVNRSASIQSSSLNVPTTSIPTHTAHRVSSTRSGVLSGGVGPIEDCQLTNIAPDSHAANNKARAVLSEYLESLPASQRREALSSKQDDLVRDTRQFIPQADLARHDTNREQFEVYLSALYANVNMIMHRRWADEQGRTDPHPTTRDGERRRSAAQHPRQGEPVLRRKGGHRQLRWNERSEQLR